MLREQGLEPGDRVAVYLEKSCEEAYAIFGTSIAGGVIVPVNPLLRAAPGRTHPRRLRGALSGHDRRRHAELGAILDGARSLHRVLVVDEIPGPADARVVSRCVRAAATRPAARVARRR